MPNSQKPKDLMQSDKLFYSTRLNPNQPTVTNRLENIYKTQFGLPKESAEPHLKTLNKSKSINNVIDNFF
jgi:hypothetical protein